MAKRLMLDKLIDKSLITEEMRLIENSVTDYITPSGEIYKDYGNNLFFHKKQYLNHGYWYCGVTEIDGKNHQRRVHILVAKAYIPNPNNYPYVCHKDDNKENKHMNNLEWGTPSSNTKDAHDRFMLINDKGYDDSQSIAVYCFDLNKNLIKDYGSVSEAHRDLDVSKSTVLRQCNHEIKNKPRCGYYFRYQSEYNEKGFVL